MHGSTTHLQTDQLHSILYLRAASRAGFRCATHNLFGAMNRRIKRQIIIAALVLTAIIGGLALIAQFA